MQNEWMFRLIFIGVFALAMVLSTHYRRQARKVSGIIARRQEGRLALILRFAMTLPLLLAIVLYAINPRWMDWSAMTLPQWLRWTGAGLGVTCLVLFAWVFRSIGANISETVLTKPSHQLVMNGPYHWVRHPLYSVGLLEVFALGLLASNWFLVLVCFVGIGVVRFLVIPREEANLITVFNVEYQRYQRRTGALLPPF